MDTSIAILERMEEYEPVGDRGRMDHRRNATCIHPLMRRDQSAHERIQIFGFRAGEVDLFALPRHAFADIALDLAIVHIP